MHVPFRSPIFALLACTAVAGTRAPCAQEAPAAYGHDRPSPAIRAIRTNARITIDGRFTEADWSTAPVASGFRQVDPREGEPATQRTEVRFLYDDAALYVAARMYDTEGARGVRPQLARRDHAYDADWFEIGIDAYHDHRGRVFLSVTPSGARNDETAVGSACCDPGWDPIWDASTQVDAEGWTAEFRIPFSQLRMPASASQVWGLQLKRVASRTNETSLWAFWRRTEPGGAPYYGHLEGLDIGEQPRHVEVLPYVVGRARALAPAPVDPFGLARRRDSRVGADLKVLLTPNLTLTGTINPDFGQVEADPAVVNLSAFEVFLEERRPFFVEGVGAFRFGRNLCAFCSNVQTTESFYSRRVGRAPTAAHLATAAGPWVDLPDASTILGAAKVTGRTGNGITVGFLDALTRQEVARVQRSDGRRARVPVEPLSNYAVARVVADRQAGNLVAGLYGMSAVRSLPAEMADLFARQAFMGGADLERYWNNRRYSLLASAMGSYITGTPAAMIARQLSSARFYQRPDDRRAVDSTATSMAGAGGYLRLAKDAGSWTWEASLNTRTPGYEVNDMAFQARADFIAGLANVTRLFNQPTRLYRRLSITGGGQYERNYQGLMVGTPQVHLSFDGLTPRFWRVNGFVLRRPGRLDERLLRGGPAVRVPGGTFAQLGVGTDPRKAYSVTASLGSYRTDWDESVTQWQGSVSMRPRSNVVVSAGPSVVHQLGRAQYVTSIADPVARAFGGRRYVLADIDQSTVSMNLRANVTLSPSTSLELFAQPFLGAGRYTAFKEFRAPRRGERTVWGRDAGTVTAQRAGPAGLVERYTIDPDGSGPASAFTIENPDFTRRSLRGNAVFRWEYRPGSTLFLVWTQSRHSTASDGRLELGHDASELLGARPDNIFQVKATWWLNR